MNKRQKKKLMKTVKPNLQVIIWKSVKFSKYDPSKAYMRIIKD